MWGPCAAFCFKWDSILSAGGTEEHCNGFWHLTFRDFHLFLRHPLQLFIFSGGTRELPGKEERQIAPAGTTALFWGGSAGWECLALPHGLESVESAHRMGTPNSERVSAGFLLQPQIPWIKVGEWEEGSTFIILCHVVTSVTQCLHPKSYPDYCCNLIPEK